MQQVALQLQPPSPSQVQPFTTTTCFGEEQRGGSSISSGGLCNNQLYSACDTIVARCKWLILFCEKMKCGSGQLSDGELIASVLSAQEVAGLTESIAADRAVQQTRGPIRSPQEAAVVAPHIAAAPSSPSQMTWHTPSTPECTPGAARSKRQSEYADLMLTWMYKPRKSRAKDRSQFSCQSCGAKLTPEWRRGPSGPGTLCNACGLRYSKTVRRTQSVMKVEALLNEPELNTEESNRHTYLSEL
jgi:hypothetical protein